MHTLDKFYTGGSWTHPHSRETLEVLNPATQQICARVACANTADVDAAVAAAKAALPSWSHTSASSRRAYLLAMADAMEQRKDDLCAAHTQCMGIPAHQAYDYQVAAAIDGVRYYADACKLARVERREGQVLITQEPVGVCALISPWNYPLLQMIGKLAPAIAAGCTSVIKPAEQTPLPDMIMAQICDDIDLPSGVANFIFGIGTDIGAHLCSHKDVDMVSFTGSSAAGIKVAQSAAPAIKRVCQELGGKSALIITDGADLEGAIRYGVDNIMYMGGQTCDALSRVLIPKGRYEDAVKLAKSLTQALIIGDPNAPDTDIGPLASLAHKARVQECIKIGIERDKARLVTGGLGAPDGLNIGAYVRPTVFADVTPDMSIAREEIFGPVMCLMAYDTLESAIGIANDTDYGLSNAVWAKDEAQALFVARQLNSGQVFIQGGYFTVSAPFGGYKQSGNGREWGEAGLHEYLETKAIICGE